MRQTINREHIEGKIYDFKLAVKKVQNEESSYFGKEFIGGTIDIATDENNTNIVQVNFPFVMPTWASGKKNNTYTALKSIIDNGQTVLANGADATKIKIDNSSLALNDFYTQRDGEEVLVSAKRNEGGFVTIVSSLNANENARSTFECDMLVNGFRIVEADPERGYEEYGVIRGAVFNFRGAILPVEFNVRSKGGIKYFESLDVSPKNPVFTKVWGNITSKVTKTVRVTESAFDEPVVNEYENTHREWLVTGCSSPDKVYEIGKDITEEEIAKALADREVYLAKRKQDQEEYSQRKANNADNGLPFGNNNVTAQNGGFNF